MKVHKRQRIKFTPIRKFHFFNTRHTGIGTWQMHAKSLTSTRGEWSWPASTGQAAALVVTAQNVPGVTLIRHRGTVRLTRDIAHRIGHSAWVTAVNNWKKKREQNGRIISLECILINDTEPSWHTTDVFDFSTDALFQKKTRQPQFWKVVNFGGIWFRNWKTKFSNATNLRKSQFPGLSMLIFVNLGCRSKYMYIWKSHLLSC